METWKLKSLEFPSIRPSMSFTPFGNLFPTLSAWASPTHRRLFVISWYSQRSAQCNLFHESVRAASTSHCSTIHFPLPSSRPRRSRSYATPTQVEFSPRSHPIHFFFFSFTRRRGHQSSSS